MRNIHNPFYNNKYVLKQVKTLVSSYYEIIEEITNLKEMTSLSVSKRPDGMPHGSGISNSTERIALQRVEVVTEKKRLLNAIVKARKSMIPEYAEAVWCYAVEGECYSTVNYLYPISSSTLDRQVKQFYYEVAKNLKWME